MIIRKLATADEYREAERLQAAVWKFPDREIIPLNELVILQKHGGIVMGAFDREGRLIAFCFGQPGYRDGRVYHYSRMLGVLPEYRDTGIGNTLKLKQRDFVLRQGLDSIQWAFDPLQSRNAYFNIEKLGCVIREYNVNLYPGSDSHFNRGLDPDRFNAEWPIASRRVRERLDGRKAGDDLEDYAPLVASRENGDGWRSPVSVRARIAGKTVSIEIPSDVNALKEKDVRLAQLWRLKTRDAFLRAFQKGYVVRGFASPVEGKRRRSHYLLEKGYKVR
jgi:predicted GNAT superfamily acetyltransferase